jgi:hypothetical protein
MNIQKHIDTIVFTTLTIVGAGSIAIDRLPDARATPAVPVANSIGTPAHMAVIIVRGKRPAKRA